MYFLSILALAASLTLAGVGRKYVDSSDAQLYHRYYRRKADYLFAVSGIFLLLTFAFLGLAIWSTFG